jgi:oxygen-independent coproporphyrinogen III oxidase
MTQYEHLINRLTHQRYQHYEISSFAKDGCYSRHNRSYWSNQSYLGIGPGAHSYNGVDRRWNIAHNPKYIQAINQGQDYATVEKLSQNDRYNEYVMTRLRTMWGVDRNILSEFGDEYSMHFSNMLSTIDPSYYIDDGNKIVLTNAGKKMADGIASALFRLGDG